MASDRLSNMREWMTLARDDLRMAKHDLTAENSHRHAAFRVQQAIEKGLKGALTAEEKKFPGSHNLLALLNLLPPEKAKKMQGFVDLGKVTSWAVTARYSDVPMVFNESRQYVLRTLKGAEEIINNAQTFCCEPFENAERERALERRRAQQPANPDPGLKPPGEE